MSGFWEIRSSKEGWYAMVWFDASPEHGGPFATEQEARAWTEKEKARQKKKRDRYEARGR